MVSNTSELRLTLGKFVVSRRRYRGNEGGGGSNEARRTVLAGGSNIDPVRGFVIPITLSSCRILCDCIISEFIFAGNRWKAGGSNALSIDFHDPVPTTFAAKAIQATGWKLNGGSRRGGNRTRERNSYLEEGIGRKREKGSNF